MSVCLFLLLTLFLLSLLYCLFQTGSQVTQVPQTHYIVENATEFLTLLPLPLKHWEHHQAEIKLRAQAEWARYQPSFTTLCPFSSF